MDDTRSSQELQSLVQSNPGTLGAHLKNMNQYKKTYPLVFFPIHHLKKFARGRPQQDLGSNPEPNTGRTTTPRNFNGEEGVTLL